MLVYQARYAKSSETRDFLRLKETRLRGSTKSMVPTLLEDDRDLSNALR